MKVNSLAILESTNMLYAACGDGSVASLSLNASGRSTGCFKAHDNSVYALSKAGEHEKFVPSEQNELIRKSVGNWLTVASIQEDDLDWFILGGGPKMSLWNRRASHYTAVFEPARDSEFWFPHVCKFIGNQTEPKIVAGGTSSCLFTWDHTGATLAETNLGADPATRLLHVLTVTEVFSSDDTVNGCLVAGGLGPALHLVSRLGYSLKQLLPSPFRHSTIVFYSPTKRIAMDCEFVGVGFDGKESALARVSIVNQFGHLLMDEYVRPKERITDYRTAVSGITPAHMRPGGPAKDFDSVHQRVAELCKGRILVGHAVHNDLKVLMLSHPRRDIRDTAYYKPFKALFNDRIPSLKALTERILGVKVQSAEHDSVEDARATMRLYTSVKRIWEAQIKAIKAGKSPKEVKKLAAHLRIPSVPSEVDADQIKPTSLAKIAFDVTSEFYVS
ncbi:unnamed protein product [Schistocephalus solidus]|uniref:RNA exonuclease 4 n=1 Tax=Schistocephalus solidus TaxID=70667 RepID=A0A183S7Y5_SCHSO|nr:unnamed protein product [Schistocephalus solidus]